MARRRRRLAGRPRLLIITPDFPPAPGGIQTVVHRLASLMNAFETRVITLEGEDTGRFDGHSGLSVRRVGVGGPRGASAAALGAAGVLAALRFRPNLTLSAHIVASPAAAAIRRLLGARTVQLFYAEEIAAKPRLAAFAARHAHQSIAISSYTAGLIEATGAGTATVRVIPPGVDLPEDPTPLTAPRPTCLTIARLRERYKGHDVMVRAFPLVRAKVPDAQWIVIGDGPLRPGLEELARSHDALEAISFLGRVSDAERNLWLRRAGLLAMPSRLPGGGLAGEGFGIVYLEAGAYGKPVVAGAVGGALDAVVDGETGLLVDPTDHVAVAEAIALLIRDEPLARRMGAAGARRATGFAWPLVARRVQDVLLEELERGGEA
jgi:phosphatidylinositol alpha-1,6-mannosyltransferase